MPDRNPKPAPAPEPADVDAFIGLPPPPPNPQAALDRIRARYPKSAAARAGEALRPPLKE